MPIGEWLYLKIYSDFQCQTYVSENEDPCEELS